MLNKILKITAAAAFMIALAVNIDMMINDPFVGMSTEAIATDTDSGTTGWCALQQGQPIYNTNCFVWGISPGVNVWYFQFDTATCEETCEPGGTNCCYDLMPIL